MISNPGELERLLAEVDPFMEEVKGDVMERMTIEKIDNLEFVKLAYMETMRLNAPAISSATSCMTKDSKIDGVDMRAEEAFWVGLSYASIDPEQWKEPELFKPDRFDSTSEWFKKPDGSRRNNFAYAPFLGGIRVCLGKTFAEVTLRLTIPLWFHCFNFEYENPEHNQKRPVAVIGATKPDPIRLKMITRNKVTDLPNFTKV